jgi:hypothetical protein
MARLSRDWGALSPEQRVAAGAALGLLITMLLPWYQQNAVVTGARSAPLQSRNLNAFQVFSFIEAAVLLVALAVGYLLFARAEGRDFRLPGSDGTMVFIAGLWAGALLVLRLFDKPGVSGHGVAANVGVQWGIFFALGAAGALAYAGSRMRAAHAHQAGHHLRHRRADDDREPSGPPGMEPARPEPEPVGTPASRPATAAGAERRAGPVPARPRTTPLADEAEATTAPVPHERARKPRYPPAPSDQMSFEDHSHED